MLRLKKEVPLKNDYRLLVQPFVRGYLVSVLKCCRLITVGGQPRYDSSAVREASEVMLRQHEVYDDVEYSLKDRRLSIALWTPTAQQWAARVISTFMQPEDRTSLYMPEFVPHAVREDVLVGEYQLDNIANLYLQMMGSSVSEFPVAMFKPHNRRVVRLKSNRYVYSHPGMEEGTVVVRNAEKKLPPRQMRAEKFFTGGFDLPVPSTAN